MKRRGEPDLRAVAKDLRPVVRDALRAGCTIRQGGNHPILVGPAGTWEEVLPYRAKGPLIGKVARRIRRRLEGR